MIISFLFLLLPFMCLSLTVPFDELNTTTTRCIYDRRFSVRPIDCTVFLNDFSLTPLVHDMITWGNTQPPPGNVPVSISGESCRLDMYARRPRSAESESFKLENYFERLRIINERCLKGHPDFNKGLVDIGEESKFVAYLGPA